MRHVLDGYKVLDFSQIVAGPTCTLMMAEMGAEVIKVELAPAGDGARLGPVAIEGRSGYFVQHNRGKKDLCLDAKTPEQQADALARINDCAPPPSLVIHSGGGFHPYWLLEAPADAQDNTLP